MAGFMDTLRGDGLARVHKALARLESNPYQLDRARRRFSISPPACSSNPSGMTTRSRSPGPLNEVQKRNEERKWQLLQERQNSLPRYQFLAQKKEERQRLWDADPNVPWIGSPDLTGSQDKMAQEYVTKCWVEQGIWNIEWNAKANRRWKHEEPLKTESESETDTEGRSLPRPFLFGMQSRPKSRRPKSDNERRQIARRRIVQERERETSRPYHQFVYQISRERERLRKSVCREGPDDADINTRAYEIVKNIWTKRGIWNGRWGILPGMSWKHEELLVEEGAEGPIPASDISLTNAQPLVSYEAEESPTEHILGSISPIELNHPQGSRVVKPLLQWTPRNYGGILESGLREHSAANGAVPANIFTNSININFKGNQSFGDRGKLTHINGLLFEEETAEGLLDTRTTQLGNGSSEERETLTRRSFRSTSLVESNHCFKSGIFSSPQRGSPQELGSARSSNGDANRSTTRSDSPHQRLGKQILRPLTGQALQQGKRKLSENDTHWPNASKVSKAAGKKKARYQRGWNVSQEVSPCGLPLSSGMDEVGPQPLLDQKTPRRSKRIEMLVHGIIKDSTRTISTDISKHAVKSQKRHNVASNMTTKRSGKPQGLMKRPHAKSSQSVSRK